MSPTFETEHGKIPITASLATCLKHLRKQGINTPIWADALCINQKNDFEKSVQVRRMGILYNLAERVIIWMGGPEEQDDRAIEFLRRLQDSNQSQPVFDKDEREILSLHIDAFLQRTWFTRAWIVQELVFGSNVWVKCGDSEIKWEEFMDGVLKYEEYIGERQSDDSTRDWSQTSSTAQALHFTRDFYLKGQKHTFLELVKMFFYTRSSRPRDKLFSLLNLASDVGKRNESIMPNYVSNEDEILASYGEVFAEEYPLDLLHHSGSDKSCQSGFCSWIPDLMNQRNGKTYPPTISDWRALGSGFSAGPPYPPIIRVKVRKPNSSKKVRQRAPALIIKGFPFDCVKGCQSSNLSLDLKVVDPPKVINTVRKYWAYLRSYPGYAGDWEDEVMVKCLIGDADGPSIPAPWPFAEQPQNPVEPTRWSSELKQVIVGLKFGEDASKLETYSIESITAIKQFWQTAADFAGLIPGATIGVTNRGFAGIFPGAAEFGDEIFIIPGAKVPFLIRKIPGTKYHTLIGECYVHGAMYYETSQQYFKDMVEEEVYLV
ncbi:hypothetical protein ABW20_dc0102085 [Dactylellina cionopaga]|nr:hypothetical protein ABW20_dc0102085 [Dactylellina cionopaga]